MKKNSRTASSKSAGKQAGRGAPKSAPAAGAGSSRRRVMVFVSLVSVVTLTSALLLALAPAPLTPGAAGNLFAVGGPQSFEQIFETAEPVRAGRWDAVFVHHSGKAFGSAESQGKRAAGGDDDGMADHFVIGNGDGCADGAWEWSKRWVRQAPAGRIPGLERIEPGCISICLIGDFNHSRPTPTQERRLAQLVSTLQARLKIPASRVWVLDGNPSPAGVGRHFPLTDFRRQLLP